MTKDQRDRDLILRSIFEKWNPIAMGCHHESGTMDCPLCVAYHDRGTCYECPVMEFTGKKGCRDTPYVDYENAIRMDNRYDAIEIEVEFLTSLLSVADQENIEALHLEWAERLTGEDGNVDTDT